MAQRRTHRAPFVVTVALATVAGSCGGSTAGDGTGAVGGIGEAGAEGGTSGTHTGGASGAGSVGGQGGVGGVGYGGSGANPPSIPCPASLPADGDPCPQGNYWGNDCWFLDPCGGPDPVIVSCIGPHWSVPAGTGQCEPCPPMEPIEGDACNTLPTEQCNYTTCGDGGGITTAHCGTSGWEIDVAQCADGGA